MLLPSLVATQVRTRRGGREPPWLSFVPPAAAGFKDRIRYGHRIRRQQAAVRSLPLSCPSFSVTVTAASETGHIRAVASVLIARFRPASGVAAVMAYASDDAGLPLPPNLTVAFGEV